MFCVTKKINEVYNNKEGKECSVLWEKGTICCVCHIGTMYWMSQKTIGEPSFFSIMNILDKFYIMINNCAE